MVSAEAEIFEDPCGASKKVNGFKFNYAGYEYLLPKETIISKNGTIEYTGKNVTPWYPKYNGAGIYKSNSYLLLKIWHTDCIDLYASKVFLFSKNGKLLLDQDVWTANQENGFFLEKNTLKYWSEWFCYRGNKERSGKKSYLYVLNKKQTAFQKINVVSKQYCSNKFIDNFPKIKIKFKELTANE